MKHEAKHEAKQEKHDHKHRKEVKGSQGPQKPAGALYEGDLVLEAKKKLKGQLRVLLTEGVVLVPEKKKHPTEVWALPDLTPSIKV